ncbi:MAG: ABC transporter ATP-binding protein, partial [Clostridiales Family XIII bacterium]|nr:ABC transporter ATP-binding protein [Clostridiales Family XIII bacterium]
SATGRIIMDIFHRLHTERTTTIILITHSTELAAECPRVVTIRDGYNVGDEEGGQHYGLS